MSREKRKKERDLSAQVWGVIFVSLVSSEQPWDTSEYLLFLMSSNYSECCMLGTTFPICPTCRIVTSCSMLLNLSFYILGPNWPMNIWTLMTFHPACTPSTRAPFSWINLMWAMPKHFYLSTDLSDVSVLEISMCLVKDLVAASILV